MEKTINLTLKVWRQNGPREKGRFETYKVNNISTDSSFLEMMDILNEQLINENKEPVAFDHDCREGSAECARCTSTDVPTDRMMM
jgi:succinate dehydrogenase / fumarate reductase iron-sulfur subunit